MARNGRKMVGGGYDRRHAGPRSSEHVQGTGKVYFAVSCMAHGVEKAGSKIREVRVGESQYLTRNRRRYMGCPKCRGES